MTKETANRVIDEFREALSNINKMPNLNVLDMAINTIRQEPCEDAISRAEAIAWVENLRAMDKCFGNHKDDNFPLSTVIDQLQSVPPVTPTRKEWIQIPVSEELPKCEQKVLVLVLSHNNTYTITTGMYEDGSMSECDSVWNWEDVEFEKWDDENDCGIVPEGWYEYHEFNPDGVLNYAIYGKVVAWMPLPEGGENK